MHYRVSLLPTSIRDLDSMSPEVARRILLKIRAMRNDLAGDVKRLTASTSEYRLRVGDYRVLFDLQVDEIVVQAVRHRREAYD